MKTLAVLFSLFTCAPAFAENPPLEFRKHDFFGAVGLNYGNQLNESATLYLGRSSNHGHSGMTVHSAYLNLNDKGYELGASWAGFLMMGGINLQAGYLKTANERISDEACEFAVLRGSLIWLGAHIGLGVIAANGTSFGEFQAGFTIPFYPWSFWQ
jgi:hypothetical protein